MAGNLQTPKKTALGVSYICLLTSPQWLSFICLWLVSGEAQTVWMSDAEDEASNLALNLSLKLKPLVRSATSPVLEIKPAEVILETTE